VNYVCIGLVFRLTNQKYKYMTKTVSLIIALFFTIITFAQLPVGHMSINFKDASRSGGYTISGGVTLSGTGRTIGTEVYYPATVAGNNQPVAAGQFPVVVFGHGFAMTYDNYDNIYNRLAALGYIVLLPRTESGIFPTPVHADFGLDLKLLANQGMALNTINTPTALATFNGKVIQKSAIGGHSMGAGCSFLAASGNNTVTCVFNFAAATSNNTPNSIASASLVTVPTLVVSGQLDNVADSTVQNSHYNSTASTKKFHVIIKDVTHCDFGNGTSGTCTIGQAACGNTTCNMNLFRRYMTYVEPFLEHQLKGVCLAGKQFMDTIQTPSLVRIGRKITGTLYTPFTVSVAGNTTVCSGNTTSLTASGATTYTWTGGIVNGATFTPTVSQNYTVSASNASGCTITHTTYLTVNTTPTVTINSGSICAGGAFTISPTGASTYSYSGGSSVVSPSATTSYSVSGTSTAGCVSSVVINTVTVNAKPIITVNSGSICAGSSFTISPIGANTYSYSGGSSVVSPTATTSYSVSGTSTAGCVSSVVINTVTINAKPIITVNSGSICAGGSFTISPSGANTYSFSGGSSVVSPTATTSYSISGTSTAGCVSSVIINTVTVNAKPIITVNSGSICAGGSFTISPTGASTYSYSGGLSVVSPTVTTSYSVSGTNTAGCVSNNPVITTVTVNPLPIISVNSGTICNGESFVIIPTGALTYTYSSGTNSVMPLANNSYSVNGTDVNGCVSSISAVSNITVIALPTIVAATSNSLLCVSQTATLSATGATTYTWSTNENTPDIAITPTVQTTYTIVGADINGCTSSTTITQNIDLCTSVSQLSLANSIKIYPNPFNGVFNIVLIEQTEIKIINAIGQLVYQNSYDSGTHQINLSTFTSGLYILKASTDKNSSLKHLVKE
jgi:dienelactone hydrolase